LLLKAHERIQQEIDDVNKHRTIERLVRLYKAWQKDAEAAEWAEKLRE
jgi:hypothetical protein